jgi:fermentation-respiration switch protein FrsA (DUF1100 family)
VGGFPVELKESIYIQQAESGPGAVRVFLTGVPDACATFTGVNADLAEADSPSAAGEAWAAWLPPEHWTVTTTMMVEELSADLTGAEFQGTAWNEPASEPGQVSATFVRYWQTLDQAYWGGSGASEEYVSTWWSDGGAGAFDGARVGESLRGEFETTAADTLDGTAAGDVTLRFDADRCPELEALLF